MAWSAALVLLLAFADLAAALPVCPRPSVVDSIFGRQGFFSPSDSPEAAGGGRMGVVQGDEAMLQRALSLVHRNKGDYVAMLFYASWCPFSKICQLHFQTLSFMFPSIRHFAFEESVVRQSTLSRYGVHGFPTLFLLNSTMRVQYHGSRTVNSLITFYSNVTGGNPASLDLIMSMEKIMDPANDADLKEDQEHENCPFSWARLPEKMIQQDTYLALASCFLLMRLLYFLLPKLNACIQQAWMGQMHYAGLVKFWDCLHAYVEQAKQGFHRLNPCKRSNLWEGAKNASAWASKSLASVSIGERSSRRACATSERS